MFPIVGEELPAESSAAYDPDIIMGCQGDGGLECECQWCKCVYLGIKCGGCANCTFPVKCAPAQRCLVCQVKLNHPVVQEDFISPPDYSEAMIYSLVQAGPLFPGGALDAATLEAAQKADPALQHVRRWFPAGKNHAQFAPEQVSADLESEGGPEMSWYVSN